MKSAIAVATVSVAVAGALVLLYDCGTDGTLTQFTLDAPAATPQDVVNANNAFAVDFYRQVAASEEHAGKNFFFSPTSTYIAFSALYEVAKEDTAAQMEDVFGFKPDTQQRHDDMRMLFSLIDQDIMSSETLQYDYLALVENLDFADNAEVRADRIRSEIASDGSDYVTVYGKANYDNNPDIQNILKNTDMRNFWTGTDNVEVRFMGIGGRTTFNYTHSDGAQVLQMPYRFLSFSNFDITFPYLDRWDLLYLPYETDRLSMLVILPDDRDGIKKLEDSLSDELVRKWQSSMEETKVFPSVPRISLNTYYDLQGLLEAMGMPDVFNEDAANLTGIADYSAIPGNVYVSKLTYNASILADERFIEWTNAAPAVPTQAGTDQSTPRFVADHPFMFVIQDDHSGTILFMGKVTDPTMK